MNERAAQIYKNQQVNTATPAKMVFMLYEKTLFSLQQAIRAIEAGDIQRRCNENCRAQELIAHMAGTLDVDQGGEIAQNLQRLYNHCMIRLMDVDRHNDADAAAEVFTLLEPLRDAWAELAEKSDAEMRQAIFAVQQSTPQPQAYGNAQPARGPYGGAKPGEAANTGNDIPRSGLSISI